MVVYGVCSALLVGFLAKAHFRTLSKSRSLQGENSKEPSQKIEILLDVDADLKKKLQEGQCKFLEYKKTLQHDSDPSRKKVMKLAIFDDGDAYITFADSDQIGKINVASDPKLIEYFNHQDYQQILDPFIDRLYELLKEEYFSLDIDDYTAIQKSIQLVKIIKEQDIDGEKITYLGINQHLVYTTQEVNNEETYSKTIICLPSEPAANIMSRLSNPNEPDFALEKKGSCRKEDLHFGHNIKNWYYRSYDYLFPSDKNNIFDPTFEKALNGEPFSLKDLAGDLNENLVD